MTVNVRDILGATDAEVHMVTRDTGRKARAKTAEILASSGEGTVMTLDFEGVGIIDFSCADEFLAKLLTRLTAGEYGDKYLRLTGINASQRENLEVALERKKLATILSEDGSWSCLGSLKPYLRETLGVVMESDQLSARELSELLDIELNNSSTRLINLHRQRLVTRRERIMAEGGREFMYAGLVRDEAGPASGGGEA